MTFRIKPILNPAGIDRDGNKELLDKYYEDLGALLSGILQHEEFLNDSPKFSQMRKNLGKDNLCGMIIRIAKKMFDNKENLEPKRSGLITGDLWNYESINMSFAPSDEGLEIKMYNRWGRPEGSIHVLEQDSEFSLKIESFADREVEILPL